jgi:UDP-N-acetylglucosamine 2-epimerase (non-hydrolysing)/GDP/UDP-N,N'-diacetylbacillosamine 2-epimerase (hydrolysing)
MLFCFPNADAGSRALIERARAFCERHEQARVFVNLNPIEYWGLLEQADLLLGNSSSGIMETPTLRLPTVNVGRRQAGRERARNVIDAAPDTRAILDAVARALEGAFREGLTGLESPYGDGRAAERIADVLSHLPLGDELLAKRAAPLSDA